MRSRRQALPTRRAPHPLRAAESGRRGTILLVLCCYALSTACLALGYALGAPGGSSSAASPAWASSARGRAPARRRCSSTPASRWRSRAHLGLTPAVVAVDEHNLPPPPPRPKPSTHVIGSALGLDDDSTVGWPADLVDFDEAQIRERHPALAADVDAGRAHERRRRRGPSATRSILS